MKKLKSSIIIFMLLLFIILILCYNKTVLETVTFSFNIWIKNVFPSLFPMFVVTKLLINYNFVNILSSLLSPIMKLFKTNKNCSFILAASMISGFPSSAYFANELIEDGTITEDDASKILLYSHFSNPMFIIGTISTLLNYNCGLIILIIHYLTNIIIAFIFRNYHISKANHKREILKESKSFSIALTEAIVTSINTLLMILGTITMTLILTNLICAIIPVNKVWIASILEMTQGIKYLSLTNLSLKLKITFSTMIISFGGISVFLQIKGVLNKHLIDTKTFILARILHALIAGILMYIILSVLY